MDESGPISVIEAAYRLGVSDEAWMQGILSVVRPQWDDGLGVGMFEVSLDEQGRPSFGKTVFDSPLADIFKKRLFEMNREIDEAQIEHAYKHQTIHTTLSERMAPVLADFREDPVYQKYAHPHGVYDFLAVQIADPSGTLLVMGAPLHEVTTTTPQARYLWARLAAHIAAGYRLRRQSAVEKLAPDAADAVLSTDGKLRHVAEQSLADDSSVCDQLELAAEAIGRARGDLRRAAPREAVDLWQALVDGRYSLVDHVDTDGKEMLLARLNEPATSEPAELEPAQRRVIQFAAMGHSDRLIGYELGLPVATVQELLDSGLAILGFDSRGQLMRVWAAMRHG